MHHTVKEEYGVTLDDIDLEKYYDDMVANPNVEKKKKNARSDRSNCANTITIRLSIFMFKDNAKDSASEFKHWTN